MVPEQTPQEHRAYVQQLDEDLKTDPHAEPYDHIAPIKSVMKRDLASHERRLSELEDGLRGLAGSVGHISGQVDILVGLTEKLVDGKTATDGARIAADKEMTLARWSGRDKLYAALIAAALTIGIPLINRLVNGQSQPVAAPTVVP